jgi:hypothetical protein
MVIHGRQKSASIGRKALVPFEVRDAFSKERADQAGVIRGDDPGGRIELDDRGSSSW